MNQANISWVDIISPIVTFVLVIIVPSALALWVVYRNLTGAKAEPKTPALKAKN